MEITRNERVFGSRSGGRAAIGLAVGLSMPTSMARRAFSILSSGMPRAGRSLIAMPSPTDMRTAIRVCRSTGGSISPRSIAPWTRGTIIPAISCLWPSTVSRIVALRLDSERISANSARTALLVGMGDMRHRAFNQPVHGGRRITQRAEAGHVVLAVGLADRRDDRFLGREIAVERAGAHAAFGADLLHRRALETGPDETGLRRLEDALDLLVAAFGARLPLPFERFGLRGLEKDTVFHMLLRQSEHSLSFHANDCSHFMRIDHSQSICCSAKDPPHAVAGQRSEDRPLASVRMNAAAPTHLRSAQAEKGPKSRKELCRICRCAENPSARCGRPKRARRTIRPVPRGCA